jgi:hypothetical protein
MPAVHIRGIEPERLFMEPRLPGLPNKRSPPDESGAANSGLVE